MTLALTNLLTVPTRRDQIFALQSHIDQNTLPVQRRRKLLHGHDEQDRSQGCGVVLSDAQGEYEQDQGVRGILQGEAGGGGQE